MLLLDCNVSLHRFCRNSILRISPYYFLHNVRAVNISPLTARHQSDDIMKHEMWQTLWKGARKTAIVHESAVACWQRQCREMSASRSYHTPIDKSRITFLFDLNPCSSPSRSGFAVAKEKERKKAHEFVRWSICAAFSCQLRFISLPIGFHNSSSWWRIEHEMSFAILAQTRHPMKRDDIDVKAVKCVRHVHTHSRISSINSKPLEVIFMEIDSADTQSARLSLS